jgi:hypothetical protein
MSLFGKNDGKTEHDWVEERLSAYLDGELTPQERNAVEHHLARCQDCQWNLKTLRQTVRWTKELPTVPVPRVFTIPAPAQPARARQRRRGFALLQGATALVALLLVFAVAGDFALTGLAPSRAPQPQVMKEEVVVDSGATEAAEVIVTREVQIESASAPAASPAAAVETTVVEGSLPPEAPVAAPTEPAAAEAARAMAPTSTPEVVGMGGLGLETPTVGSEDNTEEAAATLAPQAAAPLLGASPLPTPEAKVAQNYAAEATAEPAPGPLPTTPPEPPSEQEPTIVAAAPRLASEQPAGEQAETPSRQPLITWVQIAELVLGIAFILLATTTIVVTLWRRRAR